MAVTTDEILIRLQAQGAEQAAASVRGVTGAVRTLDKAGDDAASGGLGQTAMSLGGLALTAQAAIGSIGIVAGMLATLSGVRVAAQFQDLALSLETVTGSAEKANKLLRELRKMGAQTPFDTAELAGYASQLIAAGTATETVVDQLRTLADLAAFSRIGRADLPRFLTNIMQMRGQPTPQLQDLKEMVRLAPALGKIVAAGVGQKGPMTSIEAMKTLQTMTGQQAFDTILKGTGAIARNAALMAATLSPINMLANMIENLGMIMEPTGHIILAVLKPIMAFASDLASRLGALNAFTRGWLGLGLIVAVLAKSWVMIRNSMIAARVELERLVASINRLAGASGAAAGNQRIMMSAMGPGKMAGWWAGTKTNTAGLWGWVKGFAKSGLGISLGMEAAGYGASFIPGQWGKYLSSILGTGATGVALGSLFGPHGALVGGIIGGIIGGVQTWMADREGPHDAAAEELKTTNKLLGDIRGQMIGGIGGGARARAAMADTEIEIGIRRAFGVGFG